MTHTLKAHGFHGENNRAFLSRYFGEGMERLWNNEQAKVRQLCSGESAVLFARFPNSTSSAREM